MPWERCKTTTKIYRHFMQMKGQRPIKDKLSPMKKQKAKFVEMGNVLEILNDYFVTVFTKEGNDVSLVVMIIKYEILDEKHDNRGSY